MYLKYLRQFFTVFCQSCILAQVLFLKFLGFALQDILEKSNTMNAKTYVIRSSGKLRKVQVGNGQEMAQSERNSFETCFIQILHVFALIYAFY